MVSGVVYSIHSILSNSLYLMLVELLLLSQTLPILLRFRVWLWVLLVV